MNPRLGTGPLRVEARRYRLVCAEDRPYVTLEWANGTRLAALFVLAGVHGADAQDDTVRVGSWEASEGADEVVLSLEVQSSLWSRKTVRFRCRPDRLRYEIEIEGPLDGGRFLGDVHYFGGFASANLRWGSGFFWSEGDFDRGFNPEPTTAERYEFAPGDGAVIDTTGVPIAGKDGWFFTPPPFCFAFARGDDWCTFGVETEAGGNRFSEFHYRTQRGAFHLTLPFEGRTEVRGRTILPAIGIDFADDPYEALARHADALRAAGSVPRGSGRTPADWWHDPIFCGWGAQCHLASRDGGRAPSYSRQEHYETFLDTLERRGVAPGVVVLDDKWQGDYGSNEADPEKWPDLKGFVAHQHRAGRKVLLWLKAWDPEGLPTDECVTNTAGLPVAVDPTNPRFEDRFRRSIRTMLSADGYDADGFKLDFTARMPTGPGLRLHGDAWGLELMKRYLGILYDEAKRSKPDALVMTHTPHPYLADVLDMIRLNDINTAHDANVAMTHRARIAALACPEAVIDTDNWPMRDLAEWRRYLTLQADLGVPSLYFASHIDATGEALQDEDYRLIRSVWDRHRAELLAARAGSKERHARTT